MQQQRPTTSQVNFRFSIHTTLGMVLLLADWFMTVTKPVIIFIKVPRGVARVMKQIAQGPAKWEGIKWFSQLSDKCKFS